MRMKKFSKFFMSMLAMCTIAACSNDELENKPVVDPGASTDAVYMNVTVQLPTGPGTRSETIEPDDEYGTSSDGTEVGKDYENDVKTVMLVLTDRKNRLIAYGTHQNVTEKGSKDYVSCVQKISKSDLLAYYGSDNKLETIEEDGKNINEWEIYVYVFCNPTEDLRTKLRNAEKKKADWIEAIYTIKDKKNDVVWGGTSKTEGFLMSSAVLSDCKKELPVNFSEWTSYNTEGNAFNLSDINKPGNASGEVDNSGEIRVERSVARFDFKDGSKGNNTYDVMVEEPEKEGGQRKVGMQIQLTKMALVNMSKNFYYLRRVSDDGLSADATNSNHLKICGTENRTNYVVNTDADKKNVGKLDATYSFSTYFEYCLGTVSGNEWTINDQTRAQWDTYDIKDVLASEENDQWNNKTDYKIWRYVTENTIPGISKQKHGITTGVVFKGKMISADGTSEPVKKALDKVTGDPAADDILYSIFNELYVTWREVRAKAIVLGNKHDLYKAAFGSPTNTPAVDAGDKYAQNDYSNDPKSPDALWRAWKAGGGEAGEALSAFKKAATDAKFTLYQSSKEKVGDKEVAGYYCYYYYWNRHNDNDKPGQMGTMEFAVVRNNVYKLAVTEIKGLGHPRISENDPDPEDPDKPDESDDVYMKVEVKVLPWVVRENNIKF